MTTDSEKAFEDYWKGFLANNSDTIASLELIKPFARRAWDASWHIAYYEGSMSILDGER
jgi:hypothetical protein